jgi:hypothetical protein
MEPIKNTQKKYRFDYIREWAEKWNPDVPRTVERLEMTPWDISLPWIMPDYSRPATDHYGENIDNFEEWYQQRHEFCVKLAKEYESRDI